MRENEAIEGGQRWCSRRLWNIYAMSVGGNYCKRIESVKRGAEEKGG